MTFIKKNFAAFIAFAAILAAFLPLLAFGQDVMFTEQNAGVGGVMARILNLIRFAIVILMVLASAYFIYTVVWFVIGKGEKEKIWNGLIGLFILVAFWGIIRIVQNTFNLDNNNQIQSGPAGDIGCIQGINC